MRVALNIDQKRYHQFVSSKVLTRINSPTSWHYGKMATVFVSFQQLFLINKQQIGLRKEIRNCVEKLQSYAQATREGVESLGGDGWGCVG